MQGFIAAHDPARAAPARHDGARAHRARHRRRTRPRAGHQPGRAVVRHPVRARPARAAHAPARHHGRARQPPRHDGRRVRRRRADHRAQRLPAGTRPSSASAARAAWPSPTPSRRSSTRCPTTGPTSSSTCGSSTRRATSTPRRYLVTCNAQPYSKHDWHWRILVAHRFGHAAAAPAVHGALRAARRGRHRRRARLREVRTGRRRGRPEWGRPESVREEFRRLPPVARGPRRRARPRPAVRVQGPGERSSRPATRSTC